MMGRVLGGLKALTRRPWLLAGVPAVLVAAALAAPHARAWYHLRAGRSALARYHADEARAHLEECLRVWPGSVEAHLLACRAAWRAGDYESADAHLRAAQRAHGGPSDAITLEWALLRASAGDLSEVESYLQRVARGDPARAPLAWEALAGGYTRTCRLLDALSCLDSWLEAQPDNVRALILRGELHRLAQSPIKAVPDYRRAVELDPEQHEARWQLARCLIDLGAYDEAVPHLEREARRRPDDPDVRTRQAICLAVLGRARKAGEILDEVLRDHPGYGKALRTRGDIALRAGRAAEAEEWLRRAAEALPEDYLTHFRLAEALRSQHRPDKDAEARAVDARAARIRQRDARFNELITQKLPERPNDPDLHAELGALLIRTGHKELGERWLRSALRLDPANRAAHQALAAYYRSAGDAQKADYHRRQAGDTAKAPAP